MPSDKLYRVKPLEWQVVFPDWHCVDTIIGTMTVKMENGIWTWRAPDEDGQYVVTPCDSLESGKQAAEAYYRQRLAGALEEVTNVAIIKHGGQMKPMPYRLEGQQ